MPLSADSVKILEQAKKGKPCKFVMVTKGVSVLSIVAYRKGNQDLRIKEAKAGISGDVSCGVIDGAGPAICFKLLRADGHEKPPVTDINLKKFVNDGTDLDAKPSIQIVDMLPDVEMEDAPTQRQFGNAATTQTAANQATVNQGNTTQTLTRPTYRTADQWRAAIVAVQKATDPNVQQQLLVQVARDLKAENGQVDSDLQTDPNNAAAQAQSQVLGKLADIVRALNKQLTEPQTASTTQTPPKPTVQGTATQATAAQPQQPAAPSRPGTAMPPTPYTSPIEIKKRAATRLADRTTFTADAKRRVDGITQLPPKELYTKAELDQMLLDFGCDQNSDFGKVASDMLFVIADKAPGRRTSGQQVMTQLQNARVGAQKYIDGHKDPRIGSLPSNVKKRRAQCEQFLKDITALEAEMNAKRDAAKLLCATYSKRVIAGEFVPIEVFDEMNNLKRAGLLDDATKAHLQTTMDVIAAENQRQGYAELGKLGNAKPEVRAEVMLSYGCYKKSAAGSSDVKLLREQDGTIAFAFKDMSMESKQARMGFGLPPGCCAIREDLSSAAYEEFERVTKMNLGFPKSQVLELDGRSGALIEGVKGEQVIDKEEMDKLNSGVKTFTIEVTNNSQPPVDQAKLADFQAKLAKAILARDKAAAYGDGLVAKMTKESLEKAVASMVLTGQWDMKWDNVMIAGDQARPIDGGAAFPNKNMVEDLVNRGLVPPITSLAMYPDASSKAGQPMPNALLPMDQALVDAIKQIDAGDMIDAVRRRRQQLLQDVPSLNTAQPLVDDLTLQIQMQSIQASQKILNDNPGISLFDFAKAYEAWFQAWGPQFVANN